MEDFFAFYQLPVAFFPDEAELRARYFELNKLHHPDFFGTGEADSQQEALRMTTLINNGYKVLSRFPSRLKYVLTLRGVISEGEKYALPPDFLMDMMDLNEQIGEITAGNDPEAAAALKKEILDTEAAMQQEIQSLCRKADLEPQNEALLLQVKDLYYREKYLLRLKESLENGSFQ